MTMTTLFCSQTLFSPRSFRSAQSDKTTLSTSQSSHSMIVSIVHAETSTNPSKLRSIQSNLDGKNLKMALSPSEIVFMSLSTRLFARILCVNITIHPSLDTLVATKQQNLSSATTGGQLCKGILAISLMDVKPVTESSPTAL